jgi:RNA polymerase sigma-32 factor
VRGDESGGRTQGDFVPAAASMRPDVQVEVGEFQELLRQKLEAFASALEGRDEVLFRERWLTDTPRTLQELGDQFGISRERARQLEKRLTDKLKKYLQTELGDAVQIAMGLEE